MLEELLSDSHVMVELLNECFTAATAENKQDIANFIAERLTATNKFIWMLTSFLKEARA
jgi:DNA-binding ferritin-like protein